jgi:hypothetical protein
MILVIVLVLIIAHSLSSHTHLYRKGNGRMNMLGIRSVKLYLWLLPALAPFSRAFSTTSHTFRGQRRLLRENQNPCAYPALTPQPTTGGGAWKGPALYNKPDPNTNENKQTGNENENENNQRSKNKNNQIKKVESASHGLFQLDLDFDFGVDPFLLVPDLLGVAVACELLGLLDAIQEPNFLKNGGLLQSIGGIPTTLPLLVTRFSTNSVFWIVSCLGISAIVNDSKSNTKDTSNVMASGQSAVGYALRIGAAFCLLRIALTLAVAAAVATAAGTTDWDSSTTATVDALLGVLRECYVVVLVTATTRYVVQALYY